MSFSEFTKEDYDAINRDYALLRASAVKRCANEEELAVVQKAFEFANEAHKNVRRRSGEPYMLHPIAVARIVVDDIGLGYKSISAALLHDVVEDTDYTVDDLRRIFGDKIASLVDGLTKIKNVLDKGDGHLEDLREQSLQAENFKRILLTLNDDPRVVLIKLADRLHNCRTIEFMPEYKRDKILSETMFIFIPLAHRLGLYSVKSELENIWLRYKVPDAYKELDEKIQRNIAERKMEIEEFVAPIEEALTKAGFRFQIKKRVKTPYSVWHKMQLKNISFEQVYDLYAIRIIFDTDASENELERDQCYHVFSIITGIYRYMPERLRDWVKHPKSNGYEALHCTLLSRSGIWVEVQIRTRRMDDIAEKGIAAHWAYKQSGYISENDSEMDKWLAEIKEILVNPDVNALELLDIIHNDLTSTEITVFTPKGEQRSIAKGATALDFAYLIHTEIGNKAIAAKVNQKLVALSQILRTGDQVEIITSAGETPKREWLQFLVTRKARQTVVDYFRNEREDTIAFGRKTLREMVEEQGVKFSDDVLKNVLRHYNMNSSEEFYYRVGLGLVNLSDLSEVLKKQESSKTSSFFRRMFNIGGGARSSVSGPQKELENQPELGPDGRYYIPGTCCNPIPGDAVVGFKLGDGLIEVHKKSCPVAESMASTHGDTVVTVPTFLVDQDKSFLVRISLKGLDRVGLLNEISRYLSLVLGVNMRRLDLSSSEGIFEGYIDLYVSGKDILDKMVKKLSSIDGIQSVSRIEL
mgnify:CR=1 FL=1